LAGAPEIPPVPVAMERTAVLMSHLGYKPDNLVILSKANNLSFFSCA